MPYILYSVVHIPTTGVAKTTMSRPLSPRVIIAIHCHGDVMRTRWRETDDDEKKPSLI